LIFSPNFGFSPKDKECGKIFFFILRSRFCELFPQKKRQFENGLKVGIRVIKT
jgi:hypothetical protein